MAQIKTAYNIRFKLCPGDVVLESFYLLTTLVLGRQLVLSNRAQYKPVIVIGNLNNTTHLTTRLRFHTILLSFSLATSACEQSTDSKLSCFKTSLDSLKGQKIYSEVQTAALKIIPNLTNVNNRSAIANTSFIKKWKIDDAVFFNPQRDKCLLLLLEQTGSDLKLDQIEIIQGTLINKGWQFSFGRLPEIPEITHTVEKEFKDGENISNSFNVLSEKGITFVLTAGTVELIGCNFDQKYWFNN